MHSKLKTLIDNTVDDFNSTVKPIIGGKLVINWIKEEKCSDLDKLRMAVCEACNLSWDTIISKDRSRELVWARSIFSWFAYRHYGKTYDLIGKIINRTHWAVMNTVNLVSDLKFTKDSGFLKKYNEVEKLINEKSKTETEQASMGAAEQNGEADHVEHTCDGLGVGELCNCRPVLKEDAVLRNIPIHRQGCKVEFIDGASDSDQ